MPESHSEIRPESEGVFVRDDSPPAAAAAAAGGVVRSLELIRWRGGTI